MVLRDRGNLMLQEFWKKLTSDGQSRGEYSEGLRVSAFEEEAEEGDLRIQTKLILFFSFQSGDF